MASLQRTFAARTARAQARAARLAYRSAIPFLVRLEVSVPRSVPFHVWSFSCERDVPEQVANIRSFLRWVGRPRAYTVVSDGTHSESSRAVLGQLDPSVSVVDWQEVVAAELPAPVRRFADATPMGRKLAVEMSLPVDGPTLFTDADVLFFPAASQILELATEARARYLLDCEPYLDRSVLTGPEEAEQPLNAGFFVLDRPLDWTSAIERLGRADGYGHFQLEQTVVHLAMRANGARPLDPTRYVVSTEDMLSYHDDWARRPIALRHYTSCTRHKLWCTLWRGWLDGTGSSRGERTAASYTASILSTMTSWEKPSTNRRPARPN